MRRSDPSVLFYTLHSAHSVSLQFHHLQFSIYIPSVPFQELIRCGDKLKPFKDARLLLPEKLKTRPFVRNMKELVLGLSKKISKEPEVASESIEEGSMAGQVSQEGEKVSTLTQMEVLTEYFGFCPIDFVDDIINAVNDLLYKAMDELEKLIRQEIKDEDLIEKGMTAVETLFESAIDKYFDKFELYCMSQIFVLPHEGKVVLPHYEVCLYCDYNQIPNRFGHCFFDAPFWEHRDSI